MEKKRQKLQKKSTGKVLVEDDFDDESRNLLNRLDKSNSLSKRDESIEAKTNRSNIKNTISSQGSAGKPPRTAPQPSDDRFSKSPSNKNKSQGTRNQSKGQRLSQDKINKSQATGKQSKSKRTEPDPVGTKTERQPSDERQNVSHNQTADQISQANGLFDNLSKNHLSNQAPSASQNNYAAKPPKSPTYSGRSRP